MSPGVAGAALLAAESPGSRVDVCQPWLLARLCAGSDPHAGTGRVRGCPSVPLTRELQGRALGALGSMGPPLIFVCFLPEVGSHPPVSPR